MIKTNTSAPQLEKPMIFPAEDYARAWVGCLAGFLPGLKDRSREVFLRLSGWHHWNAMVEACNPEQNCVFMTEDLSPELRLSTLAEHRSILIHEFGVKPATANFFLWANPLGTFELVPLRAAVKESLYQEGESPSSRLDNILIALDQENRALVPGAEENHRRGCHFTNERVYMAMFQHLGWNLELSDGRDYDVPFGLPLARLGYLRDSELGSVPVFMTGLAPDPELNPDQTSYAIYEWITSPQGAKAQTAVVFFREPQLRVLDDVETSIFGSFLEGQSAWHLTLSSNSKSLGSVVVDIVSGQTLPVPEQRDNGFELAMRFARAMERYCDFPELHLPNIDRPVVLAGGSGWGVVKLPQV